MRGQQEAKFVGAIAAGSLFALQPLGLTPVFGQQAEFDYPTPTPATCQWPGKQKVKDASLDFYHGSNRGNYPTPEYRKTSARWFAGWDKYWYECKKICRQLRPIEPVGYGWQNMGIFGDECEDSWLKLTRKDGDRVSFKTTRTHRQRKPPKSSKYSVFDWTVRCSTRDYWDEDIGWKPIKPYTIIDEAVQSFC